VHNSDAQFYGVFVSHSDHLVLFAELPYCFSCSEIVELSPLQSMLWRNSVPCFDLLIIYWPINEGERAIVDAEEHILILSPSSFFAGKVTVTLT